MGSAVTDQKIFSFATPNQMARFLLEDDRVSNPDFVREALIEASAPTTRVSGLIEWQILCKDINGNEISFPIDLIVRTTFDPEQNATVTT